MYYGAIKKNDIANGEGIRTTLFVSGCRNRCPGCFQPQTWAFDYGTPFTEETENEILHTLENPVVRGITVLGGEPMEPENQVALLPLLIKLKNKFPNKTVWLYSGNTYEELTAAPGSNLKALDITKELLSYVDILVDGRFISDRKRLGLRFRGSDNQRIIDMNKTREVGRIVIWSGCQYDRNYDKMDSAQK